LLSVPILQYLETTSVISMVLQVLGLAKNKVTITSYSCGHEAIHNALIACLDRGVLVQYMQDRTQLAKTRGAARQALQLSHRGNYRTWALSAKNKDRLPDGKCGMYAALHAKQIIVDDAVFMGGSVNWSHHSVTSNVEWMMVTRLREIVGPAVRMHTCLWGECDPLTQELKEKLTAKATEEGGVESVSAIYASAATGSASAGGSIQAIDSGSISVHSRAIEDAGPGVLSPSDRRLAISAEIGTTQEAAQTTNEDVGRGLRNLLTEDLRRCEGIAPTSMPSSSSATVPLPLQTANEDMSSSHPCFTRKLKALEAQEMERIRLSLAVQSTHQENVEELQERVYREFMALDEKGKKKMMQMMMSQEKATDSGGPRRTYGPSSPSRDVGADRSDRRIARPRSSRAVRKDGDCVHAPVSLTDLAATIDQYQSEMLRMKRALEEYQKQ